METETKCGKHPSINFAPTAKHLASVLENSLLSPHNYLDCDGTQAVKVTLNEYQDMEQDRGRISIEYPNGLVEIYQPDIEADYWEILYADESDTINDSYENSWDFICEYDRGVFMALAHTFAMNIAPLCMSNDKQFRLGLNHR